MEMPLLSSSAVRAGERAEPPLFSGIKGQWGHLVIKCWMISLLSVCQELSEEPSPQAPQGKH